MKAPNWFLTAKQVTYTYLDGELGPQTGFPMKRLELVDQLLTRECAGCDALATGFDSYAVPYCCDDCRRAVENPALAKCRCAFRESQKRVAGDAA